MCLCAIFKCVFAVLTWILVCCDDALVKSCSPVTCDISGSDHELVMWYFRKWIRWCNHKKYPTGCFKIIKVFYDEIWSCLCLFEDIHQVLALGHLWGIYFGGITEVSFRLDNATWFGFMFVIQPDRAVPVAWLNDSCSKTSLICICLHRCPLLQAFVKLAGAFCWSWYRTLPLNCHVM